MRKILFSFLLISLVFVSSACGTTDNKSTDKTNETNKELVIAGGEIAAGLDPVKPFTSSYLRNIGAAEALFRVNAEGKVVPALAESAEEVDATTWKIKLKPKVCFWSGKKVDASAVIASLERSKNLDLQSKPFLEDLSLNKIDDNTIEVKTSRQHLQVPLNLSYYQTVIHNVEKKHDSIETTDLTGMYKVVEFIPKQKMVLEANPNYWDKKPEIQRVVYEEISDDEARVLAVLSGRCHVALRMPVTSMSKFKDNKKVRISAIPPANTQTIYLNLNKPQFQDVRVRQALSWALNRKELVTVAAEDQSTPVTTWLGSNPKFSEAKNAVYNKVDREKASQLLDEAGWSKGSDGMRYKDNTPLTISLMTWGNNKSLGEAIENQWSKIGIQTKVQHGDYSLIQTARKSGEWDATIEAWSTYGDTFSLLKGQYSSKGSANYGGYNDEETNTMLEQLEKLSDETEQYKLALKINERVAQQAPVICLFPRPEITAVSKSLKGFEDHFRQFENVVNANLSFNDNSK